MGINAPEDCEAKLSVALLGLRDEPVGENVGSGVTPSNLANLS